MLVIHSEQLNFELAQFHYELNRGLAKRKA